jgi:hypothetical protein
VDAKQAHARAERQTKVTLDANPVIEITPTTDQYGQLCRDLATLRAAGAASNTEAVLRAVHAACRGIV